MSVPVPARGPALRGGSVKIAVLGLGNMGGAIVKGLRAAYAGDVEIVGFDVNASLTAALGIAPGNPADWCSVGFDAVIIAVKPQYLAEGLAPFVSKTAPAPLFLSIVAGATLSRLAGLLPAGSRICRTMPNTPALIGKGATAYALSAECSGDDAELAEKILASLGTAVKVPEKQLDAVTGLSGSGPAYVYLFIESLIEAGVTAGLPYDVARELAVQTVIGSAEMVKQTGEAPAVLKSRVMSPAGTTVRGLWALEQGGFKAAVIDAVCAAAERAEELGRA